MCDKTPTNLHYQELREKIEESCLRQNGKISKEQENYIDGMIEGYRKGVSWMLDNN